MIFLLLFIAIAFGQSPWPGGAFYFTSSSSPRRMFEQPNGHMALVYRRSFGFGIYRGRSALKDGSAYSAPDTYTGPSYLDLSVVDGRPTFLSLDNNQLGIFRALDATGETWPAAQYVIPPGVSDSGIRSNFARIVPNVGASKNLFGFPFANFNNNQFRWYVSNTSDGLSGWNSVLIDTVPLNYLDFTADPASGTAVCAYSTSSISDDGFLYFRRALAAVPDGSQGFDAAVRVGGGLSAVYPYLFFVDNQLAMLYSLQQKIYYRTATNSTGLSWNAPSAGMNNAMWYGWTFSRQESFPFRILSALTNDAGLSIYEMRSPDGTNISSVKTFTGGTYTTSDGLNVIKKSNGEEGFYIVCLGVNCPGGAILSFENVMSNYSFSDPTAVPTGSPTTLSPTSNPTKSPTTTPTTVPSGAPSASPSAAPTTKQPSSSPSASPTGSPTTGSPTMTPTASPTGSPTTASPTSVSQTPTGSGGSAAPTQTPTQSAPTPAPTPSSAFALNIKSGFCLMLIVFSLLTQ